MPVAADDALDAALIQIKQEQDDQATIGATASMHQAITQNPDEMARYNAISRKTGFDPLHIATDPAVKEEAERRAKIQDLNIPGMVQTHPKTASALTDANLAALVHDDVGTLQNLENAFSRGLKGTLRGGDAQAITETADLLGVLDRIQSGALTDPKEISVAVQGKPRYASLALRQPETIARARIELERTLAENAVEFARRTAEMKSAGPSAEYERFSEAEGVGDVLGAFFSAPARITSEIVAESTGAMLPALPVIVAGARGKAPGLATATGLTSAGIEYANALSGILMDMGVNLADAKAVREAMATPKFVEANRQAMVKAGVIGAFDAATAGVAGKVLGKTVVGNIIAQTGVQAAGGAAGEAVGSLASGQEVSLSAVLAEAIGEAPGGAVDVGLLAFNRMRAKEQARTEENTGKAEDAHAALTEISQTAAAAKLRERDPARFKEFMQSMAEDSDLKEVFIDGTKLQDALAQAPLEVQQKFAQDMPEVMAQLGEATATDGAVRVPVEDYATHIAGTDLDATILPNLRAEASGLSYSEVQEQVKTQTEQMQAEADKELAAQEQDKEYQAIAQKVYDTLLTRIEGAKRFSQDANKKYAALQQAYFITKAKKLGIKPSELLAQFDIQVQAEKTGAATELEQLPQIETPEFKAWFGESKVVDAAGKPLVVYHGTTAEFDAFDKSRIESEGGFFFSTSEQHAKDYVGEGGRVIPSFLRAKNPYRLTDEQWTMAEGLSPTEAREAGYDSYVITDQLGGDTYIVFEPTQIKSATGNIGTFDPNDPNILRQTSSNYGFRAREKARVATLEDFTPGKVGNILRKTNWAILTAENPNAQQLSVEENAQRNADLRADLEALGVQYVELQGKYGGNVENSFAIAGITKEQATELGQKYGQQAVLTRDGFVNQDGTVNPAKGVKIHAAEPGDFYSVVPSTGAIFAVDIDFEKTVPASDLRAGEVQVEAVHFSRAPRTSLSGRMYGTGIKGAEARRLGDPNAHPKIKQRVSFYVDEGQGVRPEVGVGVFRHELTLGNIYDGAKNPLGLPSDPNAFEAAVIDAGFDGYYIKEGFGNQGVGVLLGDASNDVEVDIPPRGAGVLEQRYQTDVFSTQQDLFEGDLANKGTTVDRIVSSRGTTEPFGNVNSEGRQITGTVQGLQRFWDWYGSGELDGEGRPVALYHGTRSDFSVFEQRRTSVNANSLGASWTVTREGSFFTDSKKLAEEFATLEKGVAGSVMPVYVSIQSPADFTTGLSETLERELQAQGYNTRMFYMSGVRVWELFDNEGEGQEGRALVDALKRAGYDGAIFEEDDIDGVSHKVRVAFEPTQIKSATGNIGTFDPKNANILFQSLNEVAENTPPKGKLEDQDLADLRKLWTLYAASDTAAQYGTAQVKAYADDATGLQKALRDTLDAVLRGEQDVAVKNITHWHEGTARLPSGGFAYEIVSGNSSAAVYLDMQDRSIQIDITRWGTGKGGSGIYKALLDFARANNFVFYGDAQGISVAGIKRRLENLLSHALQSGDTSYMRLHPKQIEFIEQETGLKVEWSNDSKKNIEQMLNASYNLANRDIPEAQNVYYDFTRREFISRDTGAPADLAGLVAKARRNADAVRREGAPGLASLKRTIFANTLVSARSPEARRVVFDSMARLALEPVPGTERLLYQSAAGGERTLNQDAADIAKKILKHLTPRERVKLRKDTAAKLVGIFDDLPSSNEVAAVAYAGRAKRGWYRNSAHAITHVFGADAPRFTALLAAMSPQTSVEMNLKNALNTWKTWVAEGRPVDRPSIVNIMGRSVTGNKLTDSVLPAWINNSVRALSAEDPSSVVLSGPKVHSFMSNLQGSVEEVTNDAWMSNFFLVDQKLFAGKLNAEGTDPGKSPGYLAVSAKIREAAKKLTKLTGEEWTPSEVQETVWSWAKTVYEAQSVDSSARDLLRDGAITDALINSTPDFRNQLHEASNEKTLEAAGYGEQLSTLRSRTDIGGAGVQDASVAGQTAPFDSDTQQRYEERSAKRLEQLRTQRSEASSTEGYQQKNRGTFNPDTLTISLLKDADLTTFLHETGHFFLETEASLASDPRATPEMRADFTKALNWMGVQDIAEWNALSFEQKRPHHEKFARGFEAYLFEGRAPSNELRSIFASFKSWLLHVYRSITNLNVELTDEVRGVFDRMLASEEEIAAVQQRAGMTAAMVESASQKDKAAYAALDVSAGDDATDELQRRSLRDMKWLSNAKSAELKKLQREASSKRKEVRAEVTAEVNAEPINQARAFLRKGVTTDPITGDSIQATEGFRMNRDIVDGMYPETMLSRPDTSKLRGMTEKDGLHPDLIADMFGFRSGDALIRELIDGENPRDKIAGMTDQRMLERYGDLVDERAIEQAANEAVHNDARARFMATGLKMLSKSKLPASQIQKAATDAAEQTIMAKKVRDLHPARYIVAETKANREVLKQVAKDPKAAQRAQRSALLNNRLAKAAQDAQEEVRKGVDAMTRTQKAAAQANMRGEYLIQLNELLARFDLRKSTTLKELDAKRTPLTEWLTAESERLSAVMPDIPGWILNEANRRSYKDLTVEEFRGLTDAVKQLEMMARREQTQYLEIRGMKFREERRAILDRIRQFHPEAFDLNGEPLGLAPKFVKHFSDKVKDLNEKFQGEFLNAETLVNLLEGGEFGLVHESLLGRMSKQADWKATRLGDIYSKMAPLFGQYSVKERYDFARADIGAPIGMSLTRENALVVALLHGNTEGRERLANYGWSEKQQEAIVDLLDERDMRLAEGIWDLFDSDLWPELKALNDRTRGKSPPKVEALEVSHKGKAYRGGYFRLDYVSVLDPRAKQHEEIDALKALRGGSLGMSAKTAQGTSAERKENVTMRPRLDLGVFAETVSETVHDLAYREAVADTMRMLQDKGIANAIKTVTGYDPAGGKGSAPVYDALVTRVREIAAPPRNPAGFVEKTLSIARKNTIVTLMSGVNTALQNFTGFVSATARVNPGRLAKEIALFYSPKMKERYDFAIEHSEYMRNRHNAFERDLQNEIKKLTGSINILERTVHHTMPDTGAWLTLMSLVDKGTSVPVWNAAFAEGMVKFENDNGKAVDYADHVVRQTQGSGRELDVAQIMSGHGGYGQLKRVFTMFYSYFNAQLGMLVRSGVISAKEAKTNPAMAVAHFTKNFMVIVVLPAVLTAMVFKKDDPDEDPEKWLSKYGRAIAMYGMAMIPLVRDIGSFAWASFDHDVKNYGYKMTPIQSAGEGVVKGAVAARDLAIGEGDDRDLKNLIMGTSYAVGLPGKLVSDTTLGTKAFLEGEAGPEAVVFGPPKK